VDIASTNQEHNLQTQVQLMLSSWILENLELQVQSPFSLANQETLPDQYFHRMEDWCISGLPWLMHMQQQTYMWNGNYVDLTTSPCLTNQSSYVSLQITEVIRVVVKSSDN